ncbi:MAG: bifunctional 5,10-methylenetetrahydrofolate dehydrogenase/5,10-methenyltetrahydrofolate cyclohydrolase [Bacteroidota bacterium]|nr:bifunctional 5,10-methylenetetrahydrofolate dehydrogenase/5,10-methenyltetrahydrofolate cyclohydrolase [Bacteroidota bacterium]
MSVRLDGKAVSAHFKSEMALEVGKMKEEGQRAPHLAAILVGEDGGSKTYIEAKDRACKEVGFDSTILRFPNTISEEELLSEVDRINHDESIDGLIVQLPLPSYIDENKVTQKILPQKDVDGFHDINMGKLAKGDHSGYISATPLGITMLLKYYNIDTSGKNAVVIGRSNIVGRPMSILLSESTITGNATVTLCHSRTKNLEEICSRADIIVAAIGKPFFVKENMVKEGAIVIDVGTTRIEDSTRERGWRLAGDVDYMSVKDKASMITPVPGGVGPMTITGLLSNTLKARQMK